MGKIGIWLLDKSLRPLGILPDVILDWLYKALGLQISLLGAVRCAIGLPGDFRPPIKGVQTGTHFKAHKIDKRSFGRMRCLTCGEEYLFILKGKDLCLVVLYPWEEYLHNGKDIRLDKGYCSSRAYRSPSVKGEPIEV